MANKQVQLDAQWVMDRKSRHHGLKPIQNALEKLNHPEKDLKIIHVAGTNGKGSTVNFCKDVLVALGYHVGTFTSPHLEEHYDRIRIDGKWIEEDRFNNYLQELYEIIEENDLGMFEIVLLIALQYFKDEKVDYAILECGVGGRLDNTNIIEKPIIEIITSIGEDHMKTLGNRPQQIAYEKAGIIKERSTVIIGDCIPDEAKKIIKKVAQEKHASYQIAKYQSRSDYTFEIFNDVYEINGGSYQKRNAATALYALKALGINIYEDVVKDAIKNSLWLGRFEKISDNPLIIVDGAHNKEGILACTEAMKARNTHWVGVFAALKDKQTEEMLKIFTDACDEVVVTEFENGRIKHIEEYIGATNTNKDYKEAINWAIEKGQPVIITGSLYFISLVRKYLMKK